MLSGAKKAKITISSCCLVINHDLLFSELKIKRLGYTICLQVKKGLSRMATAPMAKMEQLDKVEKEIVTCLQTAGQALAEVAKDKPNQKQVELLVTQSMTCLANIDSSLTDHIRYLSQVSREEEKRTGDDRELELFLMLFLCLNLILQQM
jgi:hypothetical protein